MELANYLKSRGYSTTTIKTHISKISHFKQWCNQNQIDENWMDYKGFMSYIKELKSTNSPRSINHQVNMIKHYYQYKIAKGEVEENPIEGIKIRGQKKNKLYRILTIEELRQLYVDFEVKETGTEISKLSSKRNKLLTGLFCFQGLSTTDTRLLKVEHINLIEGTIYIPSAKKTNSRTLELRPFQILEFQEYLNTAQPRLKQLKSDNSDVLFSGNINNMLNKLVKHLQGLNGNISTIQQIRVSVITNWLKQHGLRKTQVLAGHRFISSTEAYQANDLEDLHSIVDNFHPLL